MNNQSNHQSTKKLALKKQRIRVLSTMEQPTDQGFPTWDC